MTEQLNHSMEDQNLRPARTYWEIVRTQFFKDKLATFGLVVVIFLFFIAIYAPVLVNNKPYLVRIKPKGAYEDAWKAIYGFTITLNQTEKEITEKIEEVRKIRKLAKEYLQIQKNQISPAEIARALEKGVSEEKLKKEIPQKRVTPFHLTEADQERLEEAGASEAFIDFLKNAPTKFDKITLPEVIQLMEKGKSLKEIKKIIEAKRVNPFVVDFDMEDKIREVFQKMYSKIYPDDDKREEALEGFLNYLSKHKLDIQKGLARVKDFHESTYIKKKGGKVVQELKFLEARIQELKGYLSNKEKKEEANKFLEQSEQIASLLEKGKLYSQDMKQNLQTLLRKLKPNWITEGGKGEVSSSHLVFTTFYPIIRQLTAGDIFFMVLFLLSILSPILFKPIKGWKLDSFQKNILKILILLIIPGICALIWHFKVPHKNDETNYRKLIQNFGPEDYAYIPPFFFGPNNPNTKLQNLPPSWKMPEKVGFFSMKEGDREGKIIFEDFKVPEKLDSSRPVALQIQSPLLKPLQQKYKNFKKQLIQEIGSKLQGFIQGNDLAPYLEEDLQVKKVLRNSRHILEDLQQKFHLPSDQALTVLKKIREYEKEYVNIRKKLESQEKFKPLMKLQNKLYQIQLHQDLAKFKRIIDYKIPKGKTVFLNLKEKKLVVRFSIFLEPGATLVIPSGKKIVFDYEPPGFYWNTEDCRKIYNYHIFGTDPLGRDVFTRMVWGSRISLAVGFVAVGIYVMIGIILGSLAGYFGGKVDLIISRFIELMICFPTLVLIITIIAVARDMWIMKIWSGMFAIMLVIGITGWTGIARLIRGEFLRLRNQDFVTAGKALGVSNFRLIFRHIVPNALAPVLVSATFGVASAILVESSLSFLGLGVSPPTPTWGAMLSEARSMPLEIWWLTLFPGMAIFITVTVYNLVGEGIRDAIDPRLKER